MKDLNENRKLGFISVANIIGTILVVFGHSYTLDYDDITPVMLAIRTFIYYFHMPLFFFISGFLAVYTRGIERKGFGKYIGSKAAQLLVPYLFLTLVFYVPKKMLSHESISAYGLFENVFAPRSNIWGHLWFLPALFFITLIVSLILLAMKKAGKNVKTAVNVIAVIGFIALLVFPVKLKWLAVSDICANLVYYFLGTLSVKLLTDKIGFIAKPYVLLPSFAVAVGLSYVRYNYLLHSDIGHALLQFVICMMMLMFVFGLSENIYKIAPKLSDKLNSYTYTVYLYSWLVQTVVYYIGFDYLHLPKYVTCPIMFVTGLLIPILISVIYSKNKFVNNRFFDTVLGIKVKRNDK